MRSQLLGKHFSFKELTLLSFGLACFIASGVIHQNVQRPALVLNKQDTAFNANREILVLMSAGNKRLLSDVLWIQTLLEADLDHYQNQDLKSWLYLRFINCPL